MFRRLGRDISDFSRCVYILLTMHQKQLLIYFTILPLASDSKLPLGAYSWRLRVRLHGALEELPHGRHTRTITTFSLIPGQMLCLWNECLANVLQNTRLECVFTMLAMSGTILKEEKLNPRHLEQHEWREYGYGASSWKRIRIMSIMSKCISLHLSSSGVGSKQVDDKRIILTPAGRSQLCSTRGSFSLSAAPMTSAASD